MILWLMIVPDFRLCILCGIKAGVKIKIIRYIVGFICLFFVFGIANTADIGHRQTQIAHAAF